MARPERNTVDYFPHFIGDGKKMFFIEHKYGNDGYAVWYKILETLASTEYHYISLIDDSSIMFLSAKCRVSEVTLKSIINDLCKLGEINEIAWDSNIIWSDKFINSINDVYERRKNQCMNFEGLCKHLHSLGIRLNGLRNLKGNENTQTKLNKTKLNKTNTDYDKKSFDKFWDLYAKKTDREKCFNKWIDLKEEEKNKALEIVSNYVKSTPDIQFRKNPLTWLNGKCWNDEIEVLQNKVYQKSKKYKEL